MTDLTDELTVGWHYIEHAKFSNHTIDFLCPTGDWKFSNKESVKKVIAPVPSYEELKELVEENTRLKNTTYIDYNKIKEIVKLRTLLQECRKILKGYNFIYPTEHFKKSCELLTKIDEVIK